MPQIRLDAFTYVSRDLRAESRLESKSTFECARKHSKINDLRDTRERVLLARLLACLPGCLPACQPGKQPVRSLASRRRLRHGTLGRSVNRGNSFATFLPARIVRISLSCSSRPSYETIDPIPRIPRDFERRAAVDREFIEERYVSCNFFFLLPFAQEKNKGTIDFYFKRRRTQQFDSRETCRVIATGRYSD